MKFNDPEKEVKWIKIILNKEKQVYGLISVRLVLSNILKSIECLTICINTLEIRMLSFFFKNYPSHINLHIETPILQEHRKMSLGNLYVSVKMLLFLL